MELHELATLLTRVSLTPWHVLPSMLRSEAYFLQAIDFQRVNNMLDPIPTVPGEFLGFRHPHGEIHFLSPDDAVACPGMSPIIRHSTDDT